MPKDEYHGSPMTFTAGTRKIVQWGQNIAHPAWKWTYWILASGVLLLLWWTFMLSYYVIIFGVLGIVLIPYRMVRRHQRVSKRQLQELKAIRKNAEKE